MRAAMHSGAPVRRPSPNRTRAGLAALAGCFAGVVALLSACAPGDTGRAGEAPVLALVGATVLDGTGGPAVESGVVVVSGDRIRCVGTPGTCQVPEDAEVHDLAGRYVTPGLIDAHVHLSQTGWLDGRPDGLDVRAVYPYEDVVRRLRDEPRRFLDSYLCAGVTGLFDVGGFRWTVDLARRTEEDPETPHLRAAGPLISHAAREELATEADGSQFLPLTGADAGRRAVRELAELGADAVKVWYLTPPEERWDEIETRFRAVAEEARNLRLPLLVHATELRAARIAVDAGAFMLVHSVTDREVDEEFVGLLRERGTLYAPTLVVARNWRRAVESVATGRAPAWDDPLDCVDPWTEEKLREAGALREKEGVPAPPPAALEAGRARAARAEEVMAANLRRLHAAGIPVVLATDAGNPLTLHAASVHSELDAMEAVGIPPRDLLVMATRNGGRALGRPDLGTLQAGNVADVLVLREDPRRTAAAFRALEAVLHQGVWVR